MNFFTAQLNARRVLWRKSHKPDEIWICHGNACLEYGEKTPDRRFRLGINIRDGRAHCFNCHWASRNKNITLKALAHWYSIDVSTLLSVVSDDEQTEKKPVKFSLPEEFIRFGAECDNDDEFEREAWHYLVEQRKIPVSQITKKRMGYAITGRYAYRILFPFWDENVALAGVIGRSWCDREPKYLNSMSADGFQRSFYNAHKLAKIHKKKSNTVVLVEGAIDALACERVGYSYSLGTFGDALTDEQILLLEGIHDITFFADNDEVGIKAAVKNAEALSRPERTIRIACSRRKEKDASELAEHGHGDKLAQYIREGVLFNDCSRLRLLNEVRMRNS